MFRLRDYQEKLVEDAKIELRSNRSVCVVLPTGGGKTVIFVRIVGGAQLKGNRSLILVHRESLLKQTSAALAEQGVPHGLIAPGCPETDDAVQVGMVQTVARRIKSPRSRIAAPKLLIVDECHHSPAGQWKDVIDWLPSSSKLLGFTATPERLDGQGLGDQYDSMVEGPTARWLCDTINPDTGLTYLSRPVVYAPPTVANLAKVHSRFGDYVKKELAAALDTPSVTGDAAEHYKRLGRGMPGLAFCVNVEHAEHVADTFTRAGVPALSIDGNMNDYERDARITALVRGEIKILVSCELLSEGFDLGRYGANIGVCILLRATQSRSLYLQQVGRAFRPFKGKESAIILDHVGNVLRHGHPLDEIAWSLEGRSKRGKNDTEAPPVRQCPECYAVPPDANWSVCPVCGYIWESKKLSDLAHVDGDLQEVSDSTVAEAQITVRAELGRKQGRARTLLELYSLAVETKRKARWAEHVWKARLKCSPETAEHQLEAEKKRLKDRGEMPFVSSNGYILIRGKAV